MRNERKKRNCTGKRGRKWTEWNCGPKEEKKERKKVNENEIEE